jgi:hypothetical protein
MKTKPEPISFEDLVDEVRGSVCPSWPTICGGVWDSEAVLTQVLIPYQDNGALRWRIWEYTDSCAIGQGWLEQDVRWLERARLFGEGGDLDVRRDGVRFLWRYVGKPEHAPPGGSNLEMDESSPVYCFEQTALLWGTRERDQEQWFEDRVSGARLTYAVDGSPARAQVRYREYTQAGRTLAVWLQELEACEEADNG